MAAVHCYPVHVSNLRMLRARIDVGLLLRAFFPKTHP